MRKIARKLKPYDILVIPKIKYSLDQIIKRGKNETNSKDHTKILYKVQCNECIASYVGKSRRELNR